jgi:hypothetical protein
MNFDLLASSSDFSFFLLMNATMMLLSRTSLPSQTKSQTRPCHQTQYMLFCFLHLRESLPGPFQVSSNTHINKPLNVLYPQWQHPMAHLLCSGYATMIVQKDGAVRFKKWREVASKRQGQQSKRSLSTTSRQRQTFELRCACLR